MKRLLVTGMFMIALGLSPALNAQSLAEVVDKTIVYIKCEPVKGGEPSTGSGVLVSGKGHVLTANHLISGEKAARCTGAIGGAGARHRPLVWRKASANHDAALLQFTPVGNETFKYLKYCNLDSSLRREKIFSTGFPMKSSGRVPSSRGGVLSTVFETADGIIETDSLTTRGMSGGMVTLRDTSSLIGIVARGDFDPGSGAVKFYGVLPAHLVADEFKLEEQAGPCPIPRMTRKFRWTARDPVQRLGVREGEGYCFLTGVWGIMDNKKDAVEIGVDKSNREYVLGGKASASGSHGAYAQCVRF